MAAPVYFNPPQQHDHSDRDHPFQLEHLQQLSRCSSTSDDQVDEAAAAAAAIDFSSADQRLIKFEELQQQQLQKVDHCAADGGSSSDIEASIQPNYKMMTMMSDIVITNSNLPLRKRETGEFRSRSNNAALSSASSSAAATTSAAKWTPSKMRLMRKTVCKKSSGGSLVGGNDSVRVTRKLQLLHDQYNQEELLLLHENVRVCSDCNTTTTPLWRSGPHGPKSLCNACGIRRRKARRAMEAAAVTGSAAAAATATTDQASFTKTELQIKKPRTSPLMSTHHHQQQQQQQQQQQKKQTPDHHEDHQQQQYHDDHDQSRRNLCFKDFAIALGPNNSSALRQVFTQDVEEAALLLMELSCAAFVHAC